MRRRITLYGSLALHVLGATACDDVAPDPPAIVTTPPPARTQPPQAVTQPMAIVNDAPGDDVTPPPWPEMAVVEGRFSAAFARDYVTQVVADRRALDDELARPQLPTTSEAEVKHQRISARGRRARLMSRPTLMTITDEEIADFLSFNPELASGVEEFDRLLRENADSLEVCVDHGRWLLFRHDRTAALAEYTRCARIKGISEDQLRYITTQMAVARNAK